MSKNFVIIFLFLQIFSMVSYGTGWVQISPSGTLPAARSGHTLAKIGDTIYVFGGQGNPSNILYNDLFAYSVSQNTFTQITPSTSTVPPARFGHSAVVYNGQMYIFLGMGTSGELNDIWNYDPSSNQWTQITFSNGIQKGRLEHQTIMIDGVVWLFGGRTNDNSIVFNELWQYTFSTNQWVQKTGTTTGRFGHTLFTDVDNVNLFIYGGQNLSGLLSDMWQYNISGDIWSQVTTTNTPTARSYQASVLNNSNLWVIGGTANEGAITEIAELWFFDLSSNTWTQKTSGPRVSRTSAVILEQNGSDVKFFFFGGQRDGQVIQESWEYDSSQDNQPTPTPGDGGDSHRVSCGATGIEFLIFFAILCLYRIFRRK